MSDELIRQLKGDEGVRLKPYLDSVGKLTIGVGRNLDDVGISAGEADVLLWNDANIAEKAIKVALPWAAGLSLARQGALVNMAFNMGIDRLLGFKKFLAAAQAADWAAAAAEMLDSKWARQVGRRAQRLAKQIVTDEWQYAEGA